MTILDTLLFGMVASLVALKIALLAAATLLLVHVLAGRTRRRRLAHAPVPVRRPKLDQYA
ncbi:MAG: hypothetical protein WBN81_11055 [Gammaproteobacteria bacterium]